MIATSRPLRTRFRSAFGYRLKLATTIKSPIHDAKGTLSGIPLARHSPPTACKRVVSGTISLPSQGFFSPFPHGTSSLSVASEYLALPDGPGGFKQGFSCPALADGAIALPLLVDMRFQVLFHSPRRGSFHLSLAVLVHYRSPVSI